MWPLASATKRGRGPATGEPGATAMGPRAAEPGAAAAGASKAAPVPAEGGRATTAGASARGDVAGGRSSPRAATPSVMGCEARAGDSRRSPPDPTAKRGKLACAARASTKASAASSSGSPSAAGADMGRSQKGVRCCCLSGQTSPPTSPGPAGPGASRHCRNTPTTPKLRAGEQGRTMGKLRWRLCPYMGGATCTSRVLAKKRESLLYAPGPPTPSLAPQGCVAATAACSHDSRDLTNVCSLLAHATYSVSGRLRGRVCARVRVR